MTAHPGKKLMFMGQEFGQWREWRDEHCSTGISSEDERTSRLVQLNRELNRLYADALRSFMRATADPSGFAWIDLHNSAESVFAFLRRDRRGGHAPVVCVFNATPVPRDDYWVGVPHAGAYEVVLDTDATRFGGSAYSRAQRYESDPEPTHGYPHRLRLTLPPLAAVWLAPAV